MVSMIDAKTKQEAHDANLPLSLYMQVRGQTLAQLPRAYRAAQLEVEALSTFPASEARDNRIAQQRAVLAYIDKRLGTNTE